MFCLFWLYSLESLIELGLAQVVAHGPGHRFSSYEHNSGLYFARAFFESLKRFESSNTGQGWFKAWKSLLAHRVLRLSGCKGLKAEKPENLKLAQSKLSSGIVSSRFKVWKLWHPQVH